MFATNHAPLRLNRESSMAALTNMFRSLGRPAASAFASGARRTYVRSNFVSAVGTTAYDHSLQRRQQKVLRNAIENDESPRQWHFVDAKGMVLVRDLRQLLSFL